MVIMNHHSSQLPIKLNERGRLRTGAIKK